MSLILDALKKSEAERRRGQPPTLHVQFGAPRRSRRTPWVAGAGAVLLVAGLSGSWLWLARDRGAGAVASAGERPVATGSQGAAAPAAPAAAPVLTTMNNPAPPSVQPTAAAYVAGESAFGGVSGNGDGGSVSGGGLPVPQRAGLYTPTATLPAPSTAAAPPPPPVTPPPVAVPPQMSAPAKPAVAASAEPAKPVPAPVAAAVADPPAPMSAPPTAGIAIATADSSSADPAKPAEVLPTIYQLPYTTRKDLPKLELSMHVYSPVPGERFVVLNGKRYMLDSPAPGPELNLVDIVTDGAVLEFRGQRFLLPRQSY